MVRKMAFMVVALGLAAGIVAGCEGETGKGEGDSCGPNDNCSAGLICQPIAGHGQVCCPAPPSSSDKSSCHATGDGG